MLGYTEGVHIEAIDLFHLSLPLRSPWRAGGGHLADREVLLVRLRSNLGEGWGECAAFAMPFYSTEYIGSARRTIEEFLAPRLVGAIGVDSASVPGMLAPITGHRMAKSALEMAVLDCELRAAGKSFADYLGATRDRVDAGVAIGIAGSVGDLCDAVAARVDEGYRRVKLKIERKRDVIPVTAVREQFPALALQVDANGAYTLDDLDHLSRLDSLGLLLIEQPLHEDDLLGHARAAERLATPICLDESLVSVRATETAVTIGACEVVNLKPGRVGGYLEAKRIHDWCLERSVPMWCGGMLETGLGRAANVALAALPGFTLPGDLSASERFYQHDIVTEPITLQDGTIAVPTGPGMGVDMDIEAIERFRLP